ncbi:hypothetical protein GCM10010199_35380 [Dactylosporangium roseum]
MCDPMRGRQSEVTGRRRGTAAEGARGTPPSSGAVPSGKGTARTPQRTGAGPAEQPRRAGDRSAAWRREENMGGRRVKRAFVVALERPLGPGCL